MTGLTSIMVLSAQALPTTASYVVNYDRSTARTRNDRLLSALMLGSTSVALDNRYVMYADLTPQYFTVHPGETVVPSIIFKGQWMQTYVYVDWNRNGQFDVQKPCRTVTVVVVLCGVVGEQYSCRSVPVSTLRCRRAVRKGLVGVSAVGCSRDYLSEGHIRGERDISQIKMNIKLLRVFLGKL